MPSTGPSDDGETDHAFVHCASCGSKAATSWSFCRSCHTVVRNDVPSVTRTGSVIGGKDYARPYQSSLEDARPPEDGPERVGADEALDMDETGCPKCGHGDAETDEVATTGMGLTRLFDVQNRRFHVVTCTDCGYTEFYRGHDADVVDLFLGG